MSRVPTRRRTSRSIALSVAALLLAACSGRTGRFTVTARYHAGRGLTENLRTLDPNAWVGSLTSNAVVLEVR
ncbi:MAG: hypothetical protein JXB32_04770 [Deltaproteobacteria bacterium]|nr:hypothetical protein [Deltaproteobacteria bacterium]